MCRVFIYFALPQQKHLLLIDILILLCPLSLMMHSLSVMLPCVMMYTVIDLGHSQYSWQILFLQSFNLLQATAVNIQHLSLLILHVIKLVIEALN